MSELSPDARDLIAQAQKQGPELLGPSAEQRARLREKLTPLWAAEAPKPPARSGLRWKLATAVVIAGISVWGATAWRPEPEPTLRAVSSRLPPAAAKTLTAAEASESQSPSGSESAPSQPKAAAHDRNVAYDAEGACSSHAECDPNAPHGSARACPPCATAACDPMASAGSARACLASSACDPNAPRGSARACPPRGAAASLAAAPRKVPARRPERAAASESLAVASLRAPARASMEQASEPEKASEPEHVARIAHSADYGGTRPATPRAERVPRTAAIVRTPERRVDTVQDPAPPSLDGELELLGAAQTALQKQRPSRALTLLQEHAFRFPTGSLVEERMAMQALALCALQRRHAAATVLSNLEARGSKSQLLPRVRSQCGL
ncbi:MAG TPA: hypothetical protein VFN67_13365 [Polyangiales bacterium]|nr:hypothetical protein [Polyangiales bacterium]